MILTPFFPGGIMYISSAFQRCSLITEYRPVKGMEQPPCCNNLVMYFFIERW